MGFGRSLRHAFKKATKAVGHALDPVALTKSATTTARRALHGDFKGALGEALNYTQKAMIDFNGRHNNRSAMLAAIPAFVAKMKPGEVGGDAADRARRIVRQGAQNSGGAMLLGQGVDFDRLRLDRDQELGEK